MGGDTELDCFRDTVRKVIERKFRPHIDRWLQQGHVDRDAWIIAGECGLLCPSLPVEYGGGGGTFAHECVIVEELERAGLSMGFSIALHNTMVAPYILHYGTQEQRRRWLPAMANGQLVGAIAMTEPGAGSDLKAITTRAQRQGNIYRVTGQKTFITNGQLAELIILACKTDPAANDKGISLLAVEANLSPGFVRGAMISKIGLHMSDTSQLHFDAAEVPASNLLGGMEGTGFSILMRQLCQERLIIGVAAVAAMERAVTLASEHANTRRAFGVPLIHHQHVQFTLAECATETSVARAFIDQCIALHAAGALDKVAASMAKWWCTDRQCAVVDRCLQIFGGYGYTTDYPIGRMYMDARVQKIYGGTNEIMKMLIGRSLIAD